MLAVFAALQTFDAELIPIKMTALCQQTISSLLLDIELLTEIVQS